MAAQAHDHDHDHGQDKKAPARRRGPVGQQVVESMSGAGKMPDGVRLGGQFDPEETAADEVSRRVMQARPAGDDASIIAAARRAGAQVPSGVRIHQGGQANAAARSMQASAFTVGNDVYLTDDAVRTPEQRIRVLSHELTHTGQDRGHGHTPSGEAVVQRWNPFKKNPAKKTTPPTPTPTPNIHENSEGAKDEREDSEGEEFQGAVTDSPQSFTDPLGGVSTGEHDPTAYDIGGSDLDTANTNYKGPEAGDDGWGGSKGALSNDKVDSWSQSHDKEAGNMGFASTMGTEVFGDIGGGIFSGMDARKQKGVDAGLSGTRAGLSGAKGLADFSSLTFNGIKNYSSGGSSPGMTAGQVGDTAGYSDHVSGWLGAGAGAVGMAQDLKGWGSDTVDWFKGKRNFEKVKKDANGNYDKLGQAKQVGLSMGRGLAKLGSAGNKGIGAVSKSANLASQAAHTAGNMSVAGNAASVGGALAHTLAPLQMALGGVDVLKGGYNVFRKQQHKNKLDKLKKGIDNADINKDDKLKALDHLKEVASKKQVRQGINMATGAASVLGGALTVSGFGALPGAIIGGGVGAFKLGQLGVRKGKQKGRDWADKYNQKDAKDQSWLGKKVAGMFDTSKTTSKKEARYAETADILLNKMSGDEQKAALKTLGIHDLDSVDAADQQAFVIEKLKKRT